MSSSVPIILLNGKKSSGKSTIANYIKSRVPGTLELTLAEPLKDVCKSIFLLSNEQVYDEKLKETIDERWGVTPRILMQKVGDMFRNELNVSIPNLKLSKTIFIENIFKRIQSLYSRNPPLILISDVRLEDEFVALNTISTISIKIIRNNGIIDTHPTETSDLSCTYTINNEGTLEDLYEKVDSVLDKINLHTTA